MLVSLALLLACYWLLGRVLRGALLGAMAGWIRRGRAPIPLAFTLRPVPIPRGDTLTFAGRASTWEPAPAAAAGTRTFALGRRRAITVGRGTPPRYTIGGRTRTAGGLLVVTENRVLYRGRRRGRDVRDDVPLADVAHLRLDGPLLAIERRSRPAHPLVVHVATPAPLATLISAAAQAASARATRPTR